MMETRTRAAARHTVRRLLLIRCSHLSSDNTVTDDTSPFQAAYSPVPMPMQQPLSYHQIMNCMEVTTDPTMTMELVKVLNDTLVGELQNRNDEQIRIKGYLELMGSGHRGTRNQSSTSFPARQGLEQPPPPPSATHAGYKHQQPHASSP
jgi:hypothetical protein